MKRGWTDDLDVVTVQRLSAGRHVSFIYPYYENPRFMRHQLEVWRTYPADLLANVSFFVVDDGSPIHSLERALEGQALPPSLRAFRIDVDVRWNWLAARNIGASHACGWMLMTDMDHVVPQDTLRSLVYGNHDDRRIYGFSRREHSGEELSPHPNSWFLTNAMFWRVGGYDETLSGHYGTDGEWRRRMASFATIKILSDQLVRHEYQADSSTTRYLRKQPQDARVKSIVSARKPDWRPKTLSFPYHEIALTEAPCLAG